MATYREIQAWVKKQHGFVPKTCWIAHVMSEHNLITRQASNRMEGEISVPRQQTRRNRRRAQAFQNTNFVKLGDPRRPSMASRLRLWTCLASPNPCLTIETQASFRRCPNPFYGWQTSCTYGGPLLKFNRAPGG
jgi:hypothetical protein